MSYFISNDRRNVMKMYFNLVCEEIELTGGKIIHIDKNAGGIEEVHKIVCEHIEKHQNAK